MSKRKKTLKNLTKFAGISFEDVMGIFEERGVRCGKIIKPRPFKDLFRHSLIYVHRDDFPIIPSYFPNGFGRSSVRVIHYKATYDRENFDLDNYKGKITYDYGKLVERTDIRKDHTL
ncbi:hypothetical protein HOI26_03345 [Candidatus Woesearchaeota archaeon]|jgi:hypothetical protein|nr:hypothetical protein [Candidatus Woesearchaeota archaeon]MBT5740111.1 hypothetical protein [Candidatus Woesearchaeota archaeon]